ALASVGSRPMPNPPGAAGLGRLPAGGAAGGCPAAAAERANARTGTLPILNLANLQSTFMQDLLFSYSSSYETRINVAFLRMATWEDCPSGDDPEPCEVSETFRKRCSYS